MWSKKCESIHFREIDLCNMKYENLCEMCIWIFEKYALGYNYGPVGEWYCPLSQHVPCWVPQIKDILDPEISKQLNKCPTVWDYMCETSFLYYAWKHGPAMCPKPCKTWIYKSNDAGSSKMPSYTITPSYSNTMLMMSFSTDTVLKHEERKVRPFQALDYQTGKTQLMI